MSAFTNGPWAVGWGSGLTGPTTPSCMGPTVSGPDYEYIPVRFEKETVAIIPKQEDGTLHANAHLIAASPDMYEALEWVENNLDCSFPGEIYAKIREALAKARGE